MYVLDKAVFGALVVVLALVANMIVANLLSEIAFFVSVFAFMGWLFHLQSSPECASARATSEEDSNAKPAP